jgi:hypothetical protein
VSVTKLVIRFKLTRKITDHSDRCKDEDIYQQNSGQGFGSIWYAAIHDSCQNQFFQNWIYAARRIGLLRLNWLWVSKPDAMGHQSFSERGMDGAFCCLYG